MPAAILLPIVLGTVLLLIRNSEAGTVRNYTAVCVTVSGLLIFGAFFSEGSLTLIKFSEKITLSFNVDGISKFFAGITVAMWICDAFFAREYMSHEEHEGMFYGFFLISLGALTGICFSANLVTLYMFYELMTLSTIPLVLHTRERAAISASLKYMIYSIGGALLSLFGLFILGEFSGSAFAFGGVMGNLAGEAGKSILAATMLCLLGFGTKAGMFPMHGWLPTAHPAAPSPASALMSGNVTKMGVIAIVRVVFYVVGPVNLSGTWVQYAFITLSLTTVLMGSMMAYKERVLKKRLAYSSVSQISYILFGISLMNTSAFCGAMLHVVFHSVIKNALFYTAGIIIMKTGKKKVAELRGIGKQMPLCMLMYTVASLALVGIPPLSGYISKWWLCLGSLESGIAVVSWLGPVVLLVSALLTAGYLFPIAIKGFFPGKKEPEENTENIGAEEVFAKCEPNKCTLTALFVLTLLTVFMGLFPNLLLDFIKTGIGVI